MGGRRQSSPGSHYRGGMRNHAGGGEAPWKSSMKKYFAYCLLGLVSLLAGCGYHTAGRANRLPASVRTIAIPGFKNQTQTYRIEQVLTGEVVREFISRTKFQVVNSASDVSDATLTGTVVSAVATPLTY